MLKRILFVLFLFLSVSIYSNQNWKSFKLNGRVKRFEESIYKNNIKNNKIIYYFNKNGFLEKVEYFGKDDNLFLITKYRYDNINNNIEFINYDENLNISRKQTCEFESDKLIKMNIYDSKNNLIYIYKYEYDEKGNLIRMEEWQNGKEMLLEMYYLSKYNDKNLLIESYHHFPVGLSPKYLYFYNDNNELIKIETFLNDEKSEETIVSYNKIDEKGNYIELNKETINSKLKKSNEKTIRKYIYYN